MAPKREAEGGGAGHPPPGVRSAEAPRERTYGARGAGERARLDTHRVRGLHFRTTMTESAKHFLRIARDIAKRYLLVSDKGK